VLSHFVCVIFTLRVWKFQSWRVGGPRPETIES
jgi:hypothetical protein